MASVGDRSRGRPEKRQVSAPCKPMPTGPVIMIDALRGTSPRCPTESPMSSFRRLARKLVATLALLLVALPALAQNDDDLLPVTQAFRLTSDASQPGMVKL